MTQNATFFFLSEHGYLVQRYVDELSLWFVFF